MPSEARILVVDDEPIVLSSCARVLAAYNVHLAQAGLDGLERLKTGHYDLVLTDLKMPDVSGVEILREVRRSCEDTRVILMTGFGAGFAKEETRGLEPDVIISKPFTPQELLGAVAGMMGMRTAPS